MREAALNTAKREALLGDERRRLELVVSKLQSLERGTLKLKERKASLEVEYEALKRFTENRSEVSSYRRLHPPTAAGSSATFPPNFFFCDANVARCALCSRKVSRSVSRSHMSSTISFLFVLFFF